MLSTLTLGERPLRFAPAKGGLYLTCSKTTQEKKELPSHNAGQPFFKDDVWHSRGIIALMFLLFIFHFAMCGFAFGSAKEATESYVR